MMFNFQMRPLEEVRPWGLLDKPVLHWFGLTDGWYWLRVGEKDEVFRYSTELLEHWQKRFPDEVLSLPYVDYYVVRLWEDMIEILPDVLEPLPETLANMLEGENGVRQWLEKVERWRGKYDELDDEQIDVLDKAVGWWNSRVMYSGYLTADPLICFWNDGKYVYCFWDNRGAVIDDIPAWETKIGMVRLEYEQFLVEMYDFDKRLFATMSERIHSIKERRMYTDMLDVEELKKEHRERSGWLKRSLDRCQSREATKWEEVEKAMQLCDGF